MKADLHDLLRLILDSTRDGKIVWIFRPNPNGGTAYGLSGSIKFICVDDTYILFYYRVGKKPDCYTIIKETSGWFLACQLYQLIRTTDIEVSLHGK